MASRQVRKTRPVTKTRQVPGIGGGTATEVYTTVEEYFVTETYTDNTPSDNSSPYDGGGYSGGGE
jgi:hypothetical protein